MITRVLGDARDHPVMELYHELWRRAAEILVEPFALRGRRRTDLRAGIALAPGFDTWRTLTREQGLTDSRAVELMLRLARPCRDENPNGIVEKPHAAP